MKTNSQIVEEFSQKISDHPKNKRVKNFVWKSKGLTQGEAYEANYQAGTLQLVTESPLALRYGINQLEMGINSDHLAEFLGRTSPKFSLRPIWPRADHQVILTPQLSLTLPHFCFDSRQLHQVCERTIQLGYNALIFGLHPGSSLENLQSNLQLNLPEVHEILHCYGLKLILKPHANLELPIDLLAKDPFLDAIDFLLWEGLFQRKDFGRDFSTRDRLIKELVFEEVELLEKMVEERTRLIYFLPEGEQVSVEQQSNWISELCDEVGKETIVSFPAMVENSNVMAHPFWEALRLSPDTSATPLLPIANFGAVGQGEGLWPIFTFPLMEHCFSRMHRHPFTGVVALTGSIPPAGGFLDCNLWVAGQLMWRNLSPNLLAESWFRAWYPDLQFSKISTLLETLYLHSTQLKNLLFQAQNKRDIAQKSCRQIAPSLAAQLDIWQEAQSKETKTPSFHDYLQHYVRDARRILYHCLRLCHAPNTTPLKDEDLKNSFWTTVAEASNKGFSGDLEISLNSKPNPGEAGSVMEQIYRENTL